MMKRMLNRALSVMLAAVLIAGVLPTSAFAATTTHTVNFSDYEIAMIENTMTVGTDDFFTIAANRSKYVNIAADSNSIDGFAFTKKLQLRGGGSATERSVSFTVSSAATVIVYGTAEKSRTLSLYKSGSANSVGSASVDGTIKKLTYSITEAGTCYLKSESGGIDINYISVSEESGGGGGEPTSAPDGGIDLTSQTDDITYTDGSGGTAAWDSEEKILTLTDFVYAPENGATALKLPTGATIVLEGDNSLTAADAESGESHAIYGTGSLTIEGGGSLTATAGEATGTSGPWNSYGIYVFASGGDGSITISDSTVTAISKTATSNSVGIFANGGDLGHLNITNSTITAESGTATDYDSYGMRSTGNTTITGSTVTATGKAARQSYGIYARINATFIGSTITATSGTATGAAPYDYSYGITAPYGNVTIDFTDALDCVVTASGEKSAIEYDSHGSGKQFTQTAVGSHKIGADGDWEAGAYQYYAGDTYVSLSSTYLPKNIELDATTNKYLYILDNGYILSSTSVDSPSDSHGSYTAFDGSYILSGGESGTPIAAFVTVMDDYDSSEDDRTITLDGLFLSSTALGNCVFELKAGTNVKLLLKGANSLKSGRDYAGLQVPDGAEITIGVPEGEDDDFGSLTASSNGMAFGAGIGGGARGAAGTITINGGTITAYSGNDGLNDCYGAGIGGGGGQYGSGGAGGTITINGGIVTAYSNANSGYNAYGAGAGIGGGVGTTGGAGGTITITGGTVTAYSATSGEGKGAGIGGSTMGAGGEITITGGTVTAYSSKDGTATANGAGIGGGASGAGGIITISGGTVTAYSKGTVGGTANGAGIGGGLNGAGGTITISGGTVLTYSSGTSTGNSYGTGIGGGKNGADGTVKISGGSVLAMTKPGGDISVSPQPTNGATEPAVVYLTTLTLEGIDEITAITDSSGIGSYGLTDVQTDSDGKVYFWLPEAAEDDISLTIGEGDDAEIYSGTTAIDTDNANAVTLKLPPEDITNTGGTATVTYAGTTIGLSDVPGLFTIDTNAGAATYTIEATGDPTGTGSIAADNKTLTVTKAGTFTIGLVTAATDTHNAGTKVTAVLTVSKGSQTAPSSPTSNGKTDTTVTLTSNAAMEFKCGDGSWQTSNTFSSLSPNTSYSFYQRLAATDLYNASDTSTALSVTTNATGGGGNGGGGVNPTPAPNTTPTPTPESNIIIDGKPADAGKVTVDEKSGAATVEVNQNTFEKQLEAANETVKIILPDTAANETIGSVTAQLVVKNINDMAEKDVTLLVESGGIEYQLPTSAVDTAAIMEALGIDDPALAPVSITITPIVSDEVQTVVEQAVAAFEGAIVFPPVEFFMTASYDDKIVEINMFSRYVSRTIELTAEQAAQITTALVVDADGTTRHVPTNVYQKDGKWYAEVNSLTNSTYVLVFNKKTFADAQNKWYEAAVNEMGSRMVISGIGENLFAGERDITRAEFASIIVKALGLPDNGNGTVFSDVSASAWYCGAVGTAYEYGLVSGVGDSRFAPDRKITRQEAMLMILRAAEIAGFEGIIGNLSAFNDAENISDWALEAAKWNVGSGLIVGSNEQLRPLDYITRAETATLVLKLLREAKLVDSPSAMSDCTSI